MTYRCSSNDRFRGQLSEQQFNITILFSGFRSKKVKNHLHMYFVRGVIIPDIVSFTSCDSANLHRDIIKTAKILNFIELYNEYERIKR